ncbi:MAG: cob(I)yrinic acid a,c-diamide adenosyltransferase [Myxococcales bacterium]|nr:cob(I)yrinic acid a,c-diamide adenosyltransferase [Myxococcales bacterium]MCB9736194.1 cob(I)yrinic acid a,c-diamide adenosyltransferase [Deltaproteobacteria bacterium]
MVTLSKIYTKTGDGGTTRLVGGQEVDKDSLRIEAYGTVDELNAVLGQVRAELTAEDAVPAADRARLDAVLGGVQQKLFDLGSDLATLLPDRWPGQPLVHADDVAALERLIDAENAPLGVLKSFVLPGGSRVNASLHLARTVCRRAERRTIALARAEAVGDTVIPYLNRLSDALFVLSRRVSQLAGHPEVLWEKP